MKELTDIQTKGCPDGIEALDVSGMDTWVFSIAVLGEETVYRVSHWYIASAPLLREGQRANGLTCRGRNLR